MLHLPLIAVLLAQAAPAAASDQKAKEKPKMIVLELSAAGGVDETVAGALTESITAHVASRGLFDVLGAREVQTLLSVERQRELLGCNEDAGSCFAELAGALGARFVLSGTLARLGESYQLTLQMLDSRKAQTVARATRIAPSLEALRAGLPWAIADATGTPPPARPSNAVSYSVVLAGGLLAAGGGVVGVTTLSDEARIHRELDLGRTHEGVLQSADFYRAEAERITWQKRGAVVALGVGVALVGLGALLYESDPAASGGDASVALVPTGNGAALVGTFR